MHSSMHLDALTHKTREYARVVCTYGYSILLIFSLYRTRNSQEPYELDLFRQHGFQVRTWHYMSLQVGGGQEIFLIIAILYAFRRAGTLSAFDHCLCVPNPTDVHSTRHPRAIPTLTTTASHFGSSRVAN